MSGALRDVGAGDANELQLIDEDIVPPDNPAVWRFHEDIIPRDKPLTRLVAEATMQLRRWIVAGLGGMMVLILIIAPLLVLIRPQLADFARSFLQVALTGLFGLGGTVVGFLFAREKDR